MSWRETAALIVRARREGVTLTAKADGKLGLKADRRPAGRASGRAQRP